MYLKETDSFTLFEKKKHNFLFDYIRTLVQRPNAIGITNSLLKLGGVLSRSMTFAEVD